MPKTLFRIVCGVTDHWRERWIEWTLGWLLIAQATRLLESPDEPTNRLYIIVYQFVDAQVIGGIALAIGMVWVGALFMNGTFSCFRQISPWVRVCCALLGMTYWSFWSYALYRAAVFKQLFTVSWVNHGAQAFVALMCMFTLADEVAAVDRKEKVWRRQRKIGAR